MWPSSKTFVLRASRTSTPRAKSHATSSPETSTNGLLWTGKRLRRSEESFASEAAVGAVDFVVAFVAGPGRLSSKGDLAGAAVSAVAFGPALVAGVAGAVAPPAFTFEETSGTFSAFG
jgi:hypothetical protein